MKTELYWSKARFFFDVLTAQWIKEFQKFYLQLRSILVQIAKKFNFFPLILKPFTVSPEFTSTLVKQKFQAALKLLKISSSLKLCQLCFNASIASKNIWSENLN